MGEPLVSELPEENMERMGEEFSIAVMLAVVETGDLAHGVHLQFHNIYSYFFKADDGELLPKRSKYKKNCLRYYYLSYLCLNWFLLPCSRNGNKWDCQ